MNTPYEVRFTDTNEVEFIHDQEVSGMIGLEIPVAVFLQVKKALNNLNDGQQYAHTMHGIALDKSLEFATNMFNQIFKDQVEREGGRLWD